MVSGGDVVTRIFVDTVYLAVAAAIVTKCFTALVFTGLVKTFAEFFFWFSFLAFSASKPIQPPAPTCD